MAKPVFRPGDHYNAGGLVAYIAHRCASAPVRFIGFVEHQGEQLAHVWDGDGTCYYGEKGVEFSLTGDLTEDQRERLERRVWLDA